jgi:predicted phage tail component-like protein
MKPGQFEYNGIESGTYKIICRSNTRQIFPQMKLRSIEISGKNGVYDFGNNTFGLVNHKAHIMYVGDDLNDLRQQARNIAAWLYSTTWEKLLFGDEPDKFYYARVTDSIDLNALLAVGECDITFECQPFAYMVIDTGDDLTWEDADFPWITDIPWVMSAAYTFTVTGDDDCVFDNPGTKSTGYKSPQGSKFDIVISGSFTDLSLTLNGKTLNYTETVSSGVVTIDNVNMEVDLGGTNKLAKVTGNRGTFLEVLPGSNTLTVTGTVLNISVLVDFTPEWI